MHNVAVTGPWMHDGAFGTLAAAVIHHLDPEASLRSYEPQSHLPGYMRDTFQNAPDIIAKMVGQLDPLLTTSRELTPAEIEHLLSFLASLTDAEMVHLHDVIPERVPSGLPVAD